MSEEVKVRIKYKDIEVEVCFPMTEITDYKPAVEHKIGSVIGIIKEASNQIKEILKNERN